MYIYVTKVGIEGRAFSLGIEVIDVVNTSGSVNLGSKKKKALELPKSINVWKNWTPKGEGKRERGQLKAYSFLKNEKDM